MRKKGMAWGLVVALVLALVFPAAALAAPPETVSIEATGYITGITPGDVFPAGDGWIVRSRDIYGTLSGDIEGNFTLTYKAKVDSYQAGWFHGTLAVDGWPRIKVKGVSQPVQLVPVGGGRFLLQVTIGGRWWVTGNVNARGTLDASFLAIPVLDEYGNVHIGEVVQSQVTLAGTRRPTGKGQ